MRLGLSFAFLALALATAGNTDAQPKKKKPKKPKTEKRHTQEDEEAAPPHHDPPKIDTTLREEDSPAPASNPWAASGASKKRGEPESSSPSSSSSSDSADHGPERKKDEQPWVSRPIALAATVGYASANLRIGFGVRAGYSIYDRFYIGGAFMYHLGTTFEDTTFSWYYPSAEIGYDYHVQGFTIRPYTGVGVAFTSVSGSSANDVELRSTNALAVYPGVQFDYQIDRFFVGVDARVLFILESGSSASIGLFALGGARF